MPLLAFKRLDRTPDGFGLQHPRWRYGAAMLLPLLIAWAAILWAMTFPRFDVQAAISEVGSYALFVGVFCWIGWFRKPQGGRRALLMMLVWACTSILVALLTKYNLRRHMLDAGVGNAGYLYFGLLFLIPVTLLLQLVRRDRQLQANGFSFHALGEQITSGVLVGGVISLHFITTIRFSGITGVSLKPLPYLAWSLGYELFQSLGEELFFRGVMLRTLQQIYKLNFWQAMGLTTVANLSIFLIKTSWHSPIDLAGLIMYLTMISVSSCLQFRHFQSIIPGYVTNVCFSMFAVIR